MRGVCLVGMLFAVACTSEPQARDPGIRLPPGGGLRTIHNVPGGGHSMLFGGGSSFTFTGPTAPGSASFTDAPVFDVTMDGPGPDMPGGGAMNITINNTSYASPTLDSATLLLTDENNAPYVALDGYTTYAGPGGVTYASEVIVIVPQADFAPGAIVALDGNDRVALFANGPADAMEPTLVGAAITGTVTFASGSLATGGTVTGSVAGDFGQIDYVPDPPPTGTITAGSYALAVVGPAEVYCDGTLAGHEADFAAVTVADLGLGNASVAVTTPSPTIVDVAGAPGFAGTFELDALDDPPGLYAGFTDENGSGPGGTTFVGKYLALDGGSATPQFVNGSVGGGYVTADGGGTCTVAFGATLTGP